MMRLRCVPSPYGFVPMRHSFVPICCFWSRCNCVTVFPSVGLFFSLISRLEKSLRKSGTSQATCLPRYIFWVSSRSCLLNLRELKKTTTLIVLSIFQVLSWIVICLLSIVSNHFFVPFRRGLEMIDLTGGWCGCLSDWLSACLRRRCHSERIRFSRRRKSVCSEGPGVGFALQTYTSFYSRTPPEQ